MIKILIITHGELGREMLRTAETIIGVQEEIDAITLTPQDSLATMSARVGEILKGIKSSDGTLILTDMLGGTPCNACLPFSTDYNIEIVSGVNLYMLLSSLINRTHLDLKGLAVKVISDGQRNIANAKDIFLRKLK